MKNNKKYKYYFIAGEASGDLHGGHLLRSIKELQPNALFVGVGGRTMEKEGLKSLVPINKLAVLGFWEVFKKIIFFIKLKQTIVNDILKEKPDKIVLIDYPGLNLKIAESIGRQTNIEIVYYVSPQLWAWKENRIKIIEKHVHKMVVLFPFEKEWYANRGLSAVFFGHPLTEIHFKFLKTYKKKTFEADWVVALLPGSRKQELQRHLPLYKNIINELSKSKKKIHYIVRLFESENYNIEKSLGLEHCSYSVEKENTFNAFHDSDFALVASGTATLEGAITNTPLAVVYKTSWFSWLLAKLFLNVPFVSIVNILNKKKIVEEFLQSNANPKIIAKHIISHFNSEEKKYDYSKIQSLLKKENIYKNSAIEIVS